MMGIITFDSSWTLTAAGERIDWNDIKGRIDLARVVTALLGPAAKRQGRLLWPCPFHDDRNPSFEVDPQRGTWRSWPASRQPPRCLSRCKHRKEHRMAWLPARS